MIRKIRYSPEAQRDMDAVWDGVFEASRDPETADNYVFELMDTVSRKKEFPESGIPLDYRGLFTGYYSVNYKAYKAFYRIRGEYIEVLRIILMKQDFMKVLFDLAEYGPADGQDAVLHEGTE